jgi:LysM repeat protein
MAYKAGYLIDGVYTVNYGDTLSSIGHKFGYLPQWIADANNLSDPEMIYFLQELKMPSFPSFYTLVPVGGAVGFTVLMSTAIYRLRRWRRNRYSSKKKNNAA